MKESKNLFDKYYTKDKNVHTSKKAAKMSKKEANRYYEQTFEW